METPSTVSGNRSPREVSPFDGSIYRQTFSRQNERRSFHNNDRREEIIRHYLTGGTKDSKSGKREIHPTNNKTAHASNKVHTPEIQKNGTPADDRYKHDVGNDRNINHERHSYKTDKIGLNGTSGHSSGDTDKTASIDDNKSVSDESRPYVTDVRHSRSRKGKGHANIRFSDNVPTHKDDEIAKSEKIDTHNGTDADCKKLSSELKKYFEKNTDNKDLIYKSRNVSRGSSRKMSLKEFGLDDEITIRYIPPLRCSRVQQEIHIRELKKHVMNRKNSAKSSRSAKSAENGKSNNSRAKSGLKSSGQQRKNLRSKESNQRSVSDISGTGDFGNSSFNSATNIKDNSMENRNDSEIMGDYNAVTDDMEKVTIDDNNTDMDDELPDPKRPVYDALNSSTSMILLNNKEIKNSRLWRISTSQQRNRGRLINPARHKRDPSPKSANILHTKCLSRSQERFEPAIKQFLDFPERPSSERIARMSVNPHRHRTCAVNKKGSMVALDTSGEVIRQATPLYKNEWLRIYSKPHERREPTKLNKDIPNFRDKIKSPAWSSLHVSSIYNTKKKAVT
ncbi:hypothetical protein ACF0H5_017488 [Mactra antiquata]